jgi:hypothetical protein
MMIKPTDFTKIRHDVNGNPRYVCHFLQLDVHGMYSGIDLSERYNLALTLARSIGGKKFHNKQYGGGIVFGCVYNLDNLCAQINELTNNQEVTA